RSSPTWPHPRSGEPPEMSSAPSTDAPAVPPPPGAPSVAAPMPAPVAAGGAFQEISRQEDRTPLHTMVWQAITPLGRSVAVLGTVAWIGAWHFGWQELGVVAAACLIALLIGVTMLLAGGVDLRVMLELGTK